jgi:hypothetical protein
MYINYNSTGTTSNAIRFYTPGTTQRMVIMSNGNVGIGTTTPGYTLDVAGGIRATELTLTGSNSLNPLWPEGVNGTVKNIVVSNTSGYTVPAGKTLYILSEIASNANSISARLLINNVAFASADANNGGSRASPLMVPAGAVVKTEIYNGQATSHAITGIEITDTPEITPVNVVVSNTSGYTVPAGKTLYILSEIASAGAYASSAHLLINNVAFASIVPGDGSRASPLVVPAGAVVKTEMVNGQATSHAITGYLR